MAIFSQSRADLYNHAFEQPRDALADLSGTPQHIITMIFQRTNSTYRPTYGDIVDALAPTLEEARNLGVLRANALQLALDMFDEKKTLIHKRSMAPEVVDFMFDKLKADQPMDFYSIWDVIDVLRPTPSEAQQCEQRREELETDWQSLLHRMSKPSRSTPFDGFDDDELDF